jgi:hypothetical protein
MRELSPIIWTEKKKGITQAGWSTQVLMDEWMGEESWGCVGYKVQYWGCLSPLWHIVTRIWVYRVVPMMDFFFSSTGRNPRGQKGRHTGFSSALTCPDSFVTLKKADHLVKWSKCQSGEVRHILFRIFPFLSFLGNIMFDFRCLFPYLQLQTQFWREFGNTQTVPTMSTCLLTYLLTHTSIIFSFVVFQDHNWLWLHQDSVSQQQSVSTSNNSSHCIVLLHLGKLAALFQRAWSWAMEMQIPRTGIGW